MDAVAGLTLIIKDKTLDFTSKLFYLLTVKIHRFQVGDYIKEVDGLPQA